MKKYIYISIISMIFTTLLSCSTNEESLTNSNLDVNTPKLNTTDKWLRKNYTFPYNIEVNYPWKEGVVDLNRYLYPPKLENVIPVMEVVKKVWIDTYSKLGGEDFVKKIAPRQLSLIGGVNRNPSGTRTLGFAEGGKNIVLFEVDLVNLKNRESIKEFVKTVQHEYAHILNQTVRFDEEAFKKITPGSYTAQWFNLSNNQANNLGFITNYASLNYKEDFAEMVKILLTNTKGEYENILKNIRSIKAVADIRKKEAIVAAYFKKEFNIDLYELQKLANENMSEVVKNKL